MPFVVLLLAVLFISCNSQKPASESTASLLQKEEAVTVKKQRSLASVKNQSVSQDDFRDYLKFRPFRKQPLDSEDLKERLDELITSEVLYQEALAQKLDQDPAIKRKIRQILNQKLLKSAIEDPIRNQEISDTELQSYYDSHSDNFNRKAQIRVANIFIAVDPQSSKDEKQALRKEAETILQKALAIEGQPSGFGPLIRQHSDTPPHFTKGDTGYFDDTGAPKNLSKAFVTAAYQLKKIGAITPKLVETEQGFHIMMLIGKRPPRYRAFESVKHEIKRKMLNQRLKDRKTKYVQQLKQSSQIDINEELLNELLTEFQQASPPATQHSPRSALMLPNQLNR